MIILKLKNIKLKIIVFNQIKVYASTYHEIFTFPLLIPLYSPTTWLSAYGRTGSFRFGFFCWAIFNKFFHFYSFFCFYFFTSFGSWSATYILFWSFFSSAFSNITGSIYFRIDFKAFKDSCRTLCQWVYAKWPIIGTSRGNV